MSYSKGMGRVRSLLLLPTDQLRALVLGLMVKHQGDIEKVAKDMEKDDRTVRRYIQQLNLWPELDKMGFKQRSGPPRGHRVGTYSKREAVIVPFIRKHDGKVDYDDLAKALYGVSSDRALNATHNALSELKAKGVIASDGYRWWVVKPSNTEPRRG